MKLVLGTFARGGIEAIWGGDLSSGVRRALRHYARRDRGGLPQRSDRRFPVALGEDGLSLDLLLDGETERALERRARECRGVTAEQLAAHAVLVYLADRDAQLTAGSR